MAARYRVAMLRAGRGRPPPRWRTLAPSVVGPLVIVSAVLVVLHDFAFQGKVSSQHGDILSTWLPTHCLLGESLSAGHVPAWNPFVMAGVPFAADPQSGWMYLPVMLLYTLLPCSAAIRWFMVLQPLLAGLGLYAFLRTERVSRPSCTAAGLTLGLLIADSHFVLELPFSGTLAWSAVLLAAASRYVRAESWPPRLLWLVATALAWGQVAAAHLSNGLVVATLTLGAYLLAKAIADIRTGNRPRADVLVMGALVPLALPLVNLAYLLPRTAYLPRSTLGIGYQGLRELASQIRGVPPATDIAPVVQGLHELWPLELMRSPGANLGAAAAAVVFAGWWGGRHRHLVVAFTVVAAVCYVASLQSVADLLSPAIVDLPFADFYLHAPGRFRYGVVLVLPILAALGIEAWIAERRPRLLLLMLSPGLVLWWALPLLTGRAQVEVAGFVLFALTAAAAVLLIVALRPGLVWVVPAVLALELTTNGLLGQATGSPVREPAVDAPAYLRPGKIALAVDTDEGRFQRIGAGLRRSELLPDPANWAVLASQRSMLFELEDVTGYNPAQLPRYWSFVRAVNTKPVKYNAASFGTVESERLAVVLDLMDVGWVIAPADAPPPIREAVPVVQEQRWLLYRLTDSPPRASVYTSWTTVGSSMESLRAVTAGGFDPRTTLIVERAPAESLGVSAAAARSEGSYPAQYRATGWQSATVEAMATSPAMVLVRTSYDANWHATVDGRPAPVFPADHLLQAVPIGPGRHTIVLKFDEPAIGAGLIGSLLALAALVIGAVGAYWRERSVRRRRASPSEPGRSDSSAESPPSDRVAPVRPAEPPPHSPERV
jgi:hypothetical protein